MSNLTDRPARRPAQAKLMRAINVPMRALLGLPFPTLLGSRLMLVHLTDGAAAATTASRSATPATARH
jgi:hypothetical protein